MVVHLQQNQPASVWGEHFNGGANQTWGIRFQVAEGFTVDAVGYYATQGYHRWSNLAIYDAGATPIWQTVGTGGPSVGNWFWESVSPTVELVPGVTYTLAGYWDNWVLWGGGTTGRSAPPYPFIYDDYYHTLLSGSWGKPVTGQTSDFPAISLRGLPHPDGGGTGGGATPPEVGDELAKWLSSISATQLHETDGLPWLIKQVVDLIYTDNQFIKNEVTATKILLDAVYSILHDVPSGGMSLTEFLQRMTPALIDAATVFFTDADPRLLGTGPGGGTAFHSSDGRQVAQTAADIQDQVTSLASQVSQLAGNVEQLQAPLFGFPTDFELVDEFTFVDCVAWNVAADVYVLHITDVPRGLVLDPMCGVNMVRRAGWWSPLADTLPGERKYIDFEFNLLYDQGGRLPGILVELGVEGGATIQAWNRLPPPIGP